MNASCQGCEWVVAEITARQQIGTAFFNQGDLKMAELAMEGISALLRDWHSHLERDHPEIARMPACLQDEVQVSEPVDI